MFAHPVFIVAVLQENKWRGLKKAAGLGEGKFKLSLVAMHHTSFANTISQRANDWF